MPVRIISPEEVRQVPSNSIVVFVDSLVRLGMLTPEQRNCVLSVDKNKLDEVMLSAGTALVIFARDIDLNLEARKLDAANFTDKDIYVTRLP